MHITNYVLHGQPVGMDARSLRHMRMRNQLFKSQYLGFLAKETELFQALLYASLRKGQMAVKQIVIPASIIQVVMLVVTLSYFFIPASQSLFQAVSNLRSASGPAFAFLSMGGIAVFAECLRRSSTRDWSGFRNAALFGFVVFGVLGLATDAFYTLQDWLWAGINPTAQIIAKVLMDQFIYTVIFANPYQTFLYVFKDCGFNVGRFTRRIQPLKLFYVREVLAVLITNWAFWIPMTAIIYSLPLDIQFVISRMAVVIWVLLLSAITRKG